MKNSALNLSIEQVYSKLIMDFFIIIQNFPDQTICKNYLFLFHSVSIEFFICFVLVFFFNLLKKAFISIFEERNSSNVKPVIINHQIAAFNKGIKQIDLSFYEMQRVV